MSALFTVGAIFSVFQVVVAPSFAMGWPYLAVAAFCAALAAFGFYNAHARRPVELGPRGIQLPLGGFIEWDNIDGLLVCKYDDVDIANVIAVRLVDVDAYLQTTNLSDEDLEWQRSRTKEHAATTGYHLTIHPGTPKVDVDQFAELISAAAAQHGKALSWETAAKELHKGPQDARRPGSGRGFRRKSGAPQDSKRSPEVR